MRQIFKNTFFAFALLCSTGVFAQELTAFEIMKKNDDLQKPKDTYSEIKLTLTDKRGNSIERSLISYSLKTDFGYNSFIEVTSPADVSGMKLLSIAKEGEDEQRIYMPAFGKVRKISSSGKTGKFLGSDIYFYDLEDYNLNEFTYSLNGTKEWNGKQYYLITAIPKNNKAPYSKTIHWVSKENFFIYKSEMFDKKGSLLKTLVINKTKTEQNIIIPAEMTFTTVKTGHFTKYTLLKDKINTGVSEEIFTVKYLEK